MLLHETLERSAVRYPGKEALIFEDRRLCYSEIDQFANALACGLIDAGIQRQDRVGIFLDNSVESVISIFGILKASAVFVIINTQTKARKVKYILNDCQIRVLITDAQHLSEIDDLISDCPHLKVLINVDGSEVLSSKVMSRNRIRFYSFDKIMESATVSAPPNRNINMDLASLIYTSGTTGNPKGVMLSHLNMVSAAESIIQYLENTNDDILIDCLPLSFDYGLYQILMAFKFGGTVVLERSFLYPYRIIELILRERITGFPIVPTIASIFLKLKNLDSTEFPSLRYITNTGQALAPKHIHGLKKIFPCSKLYSMYGLTECKRVCYLPPEDIMHKPTSVGKAIPNTEAWIVNREGTRISDPGEIGELVVRGVNVMKGYWNLPEETARRLKQDAVTGDTVLYTGDLFKMDEDGDLYFVSRKDDIIKTGGEMVSPKEVENVLYEIEEIVEAAVIGVDDEILGQVVKAIVVPKNGSLLNEQTIKIHCAKYLENYMVPKIITIQDQLPKTSTGKISKKGLV